MALMGLAAATANGSLGARAGAMAIMIMAPPIMIMAPLCDPNVIRESASEVQIAPTRILLAVLDPRVTFWHRPATN